MAMSPLSNSNNKVNVEYIVARYMVKYNRLRFLIPAAFENSNEFDANIYIDLYGLYKTLFSRNYSTDTSNYISFTSSIVNMCAHYRKFFRSIGVRTKIFIISSYNIPDHSCKSVIGYNSTMIDKLRNQDVMDMISLNDKLLEVLCPYLPQIYYLKTEYESSVLMKAIIDKEAAAGNTHPNIIISSDIYPIQLTANISQTAFIRPMKYNGQDNSCIVFPREHPGHIQSFWGLLSQRSEGVEAFANTILDTRCMSMIFALNKFPERNIKTLVNISQAINILSDIGFVNCETLFKLKPEIIDKISPATLESRYKAIDINYQYLLYSNSLEIMEIKYEDLVDMNAVKLIVSKYFVNDPINIFDL